MRNKNRQSSSCYWCNSLCDASANHHQEGKIDQSTSRPLLILDSECAHPGGHIGFSDRPGVASQVVPALVADWLGTSGQPMTAIPTRTKVTAEMSFHARRRELATPGVKETSRSVPAQKCRRRTHEMWRGGQETWCARHRDRQRTQQSWRARQNMIVPVKSGQVGRGFL